MKYCMVIMLLLVVGCGTSVQAQETEQVSVAALKKLGARIGKDGVGNDGVENVVRFRHTRSLISTRSPIITDAGVAELQKALPDCKIVVFRL